MLVGRKPFECDDLVKLLAMQITAAPRRFAEMTPDAHVTPEIEAAVMRALEKERDRRFATAADFRAAIEHASTDVAERGARFAATSVRMGITAGTRLWAKRGEARTLLRRAWAKIAQGKGRLDKLADPVLKHAPAAIRRFVLPAVAILFLLVICWPGNKPAHKGTLPKSEPPKPKPVAAELKSPIKHIEETMAKGQLTEARVAIMQQISEHPNEGRVRYLLGNLEFADKNPSAGLQAYEEALRLDPGLRGDAALLVNIRSELSDKRVGFIALEMLIKQVGKPAGDLLADIASDDHRPEFRQAAREACESLGCLGKVDQVASYALDLAQAHTCEEKRAAIQKLGGTGDPKAIDALRKARVERRSLLGSLLSSSSNGCVIKDIDAALTALGAPPPPPPPTHKRRRR